MAIDDREDVLDALQQLLSSDGVQLQPFATGHAALQWLEDRDTADWPHALVCDIALGEEDGAATLGFNVGSAPNRSDLARASVLASDAASALPAGSPT